MFKGISLRASQFLNERPKKVIINWFLNKYLKHLPPHKIHSFRLLNHKTYFYGGPAFLHGVQEIFIDEIYNQSLPENAYILDCGAHIGLSVIYLKNICPSAHIVCFEPDATNFDLLQKNISSHNLNRVEAKNAAVWVENGSLNFIQAGDMASKIGSDNENTVSVAAIRLKDYLNKKIDFLKLDIEGAEYKVIKDIAGDLANVGNLFIEYHGNFQQNPELLEIFEIISKAGFKYYIREAAINHVHPFLAHKTNSGYDLQLNIFCFRNFIS